MSGLQKLDADQPNIAPADDLLSRKSRTFVHPEEVVDGQTLTIAIKRSLLAAWASDALAVENSPSLRQLPSDAVVRVDDIVAALKSPDLHEPRYGASQAFSRSFARRRSKPVARRRTVRPEDDDDPPPSATSARLPSAWKILTGVRRYSTNRYLDSIVTLTLGGREGRGLLFPVDHAGFRVQVSCCQTLKACERISR